MRDFKEIFQQCDTQKRSSYVVEQLLGALARGELESGEKLPPENELSMMMGVSRPSVREALSVLRFEGIIETRVGDGTYLADLADGHESNGTSLLMTLLRSGEHPLALLDARTAIERATAAAAANHRTGNDIRDLEAAFKALTEAVSQADIPGIIESGWRFHIGVARASANPVLEAFLASILDTLRSDAWRATSHRLLAGDPCYLAQEGERHETILKAIKQSDPDLAEHAVSEHFAAMRTGYQTHRSASDRSELQNGE
jgi:GntR family transcriptional repressor for pyruvate dehydrogenase complex